jgi:hypothetical protein
VSEIAGIGTTTPLGDVTVLAGCPGTKYSSLMFDGRAVGAVQLTVAASQQMPPENSLDHVGDVNAVAAGGKSSGGGATLEDGSRSTAGKLAMTECVPPVVK